jgi:hypothetical protein
MQAKLYAFTARLIEIFVSNDGFMNHPRPRTDSAVSIIKASLAKRLT